MNNVVVKLIVRTECKTVWRIDLKANCLVLDPPCLSLGGVTAVNFVER